MDTPRAFGCKPDTTDTRDHQYKVSRIPSDLPPSTDLRYALPEPYDQGSLGSCTAQAIGANMQFLQRKQGIPDFTPSRLFIYFFERAAEGTIAEDAGAMIRTGIKVTNELGACPEHMWPYDIAKFTHPPAPPARDAALLNQSLAYQRVQVNKDHMKACLAEGFPFVFGMKLYDSFQGQETATSGHVPMPEPEEKCLGGHAMLAVGYDDKHQAFLVRNSWGPAWGLAGYCWIPYGYLADPNQTSDVWTIRLIEA